MSWAWQWHWWANHAAELKAELVLLAGYDHGGRLVGLAPLYLGRGLHKGFSAVRLETLGSRWRGGANVFSEYLDFIVDRACVDSFLRAVSSEILADRRWSDFVVGNTKVDSLAVRLVREHFPSHYYLRSTDPMVAHVAHLPSSFEDYLRMVDGSTRRRLWHHRKKLRDPLLRRIDGTGVIEALDQLDRFHRIRWGSAHYTGVRRRFHEQFAIAMSASKALNITELQLAGRTISIMYNVRVGGTEYNIQSGFDAAFRRGISPGYLHFGYAIEEACAIGMGRFDFLGGAGLHRQYKSDFLTSTTEMITLQSIRSRPLAWLYRRYDRRR